MKVNEHCMTLTDTPSRKKRDKDAKARQLLKKRYSVPTKGRRKDERTEQRFEKNHRWGCKKTAGGGGDINAKVL